MGKNNFKINIGLTSFLMVFIVLCLVTFSVLSLVSAKNQYESSHKSLNHQEAYYQANNEANVILDNIDTILHKSIINTNSKEIYYNKVISELTDKDYLFNEGQLEYVVKISKKQNLHVILEVLYGSSDHNLYNIKTWEVENSSEWHPNNDLNLLQ